MTKKAFFLALMVGILSACSSSKKSVYFTVPNQKFVAPATVTFANTMPNSESYFWEFGDGTTSTEANPTHRFAHSGNYTVILKIKNGLKTKISKQMVQVTPPDQCLVEIETEFGTMVAELYSGTPKHRDNFIKLAEEGYYNDLLFHRVIRDFMVQGGDPNSRNAPAGQALGFGGPNYLIPAEFQDSLVHIKGAIAAARTNNPEKKSSGSQFYIVTGQVPTDEMLNQIESMKNFHYTPEQREAYKKYGGTPHLDRDYTVFGRIISGLDILDKVGTVETAPGDRPKKDVKMRIKVVK